MLVEDETPVGRLAEMNRVSMRSEGSTEIRSDLAAWVGDWISKTTSGGCRTTTELPAMSIGHGGFQLIGDGGG